MPTLRYASRMPHPREALFAWHDRAGALPRLLPPWESASLVRHDPPVHAGVVRSVIDDGTELVIRLRKGPITIDWLAHHDHYRPGHRFRDTQRSGPFASWVHTHRTVSTGTQHGRASSELVDDILFSLPGGVVGNTIGAPIITRDLDRQFRWRHMRTRRDLDRHAPFAGQPRRRILMGGASGLIGTQLAAFLTTGGHTVDRLVRRPLTNTDNTPASVAVRGGRLHQWSPMEDASDALDQDAIDQADAVIHLGGLNVATIPWNANTRAAIHDSRVRSTRLLARRIAASPTPPKTLVLASAIGYYGHRPGEVVTEESAPGDGFLASVVQDWEHAAQPAIDAGCRVVLARIGIVLSPKGGALGKLLPIAKLGLGGRLGEGTQHWAWIGLDDTVGALYHLLMTESASGAYNVVAPDADDTLARGGATQATIARELSMILGRPSLMNVPAWALRARFGREMANETVLKDIRASAARLTDTGFTFLTPDVPAAIRWELGRV